MIGMTLLIVVGLALVGMIAWTLRVTMRDDPGPRPTRDLYDTRRPE